MHSRRTVVLGTAVATLAGCLGDDDDGGGRLDHRGDIEIVVDGDPIDLSKDRYQAEHADEYSMSFHFHETSDQWYNEGERPVTVAEGLDKLPKFRVDVSDGDMVLTIDDRTFDARDENTTIGVTVNDEVVDPETYELEDGDAIHIAVTTADR